MKPCRFVDDYQSFGGTCRPHLQVSSETVGTTYKIALRHNHEGCDSFLNRLENLKSEILLVLLTLIIYNILNVTVIIIQLFAAHLILHWQCVSLLSTKFAKSFVLVSSVENFAIEWLVCLLRIRDVPV